MLVPATAVETAAGTSRVYTVTADHKVEERIVTLGEKLGDRIEVSSGVKPGERVVANPRGKLADGVRVQIEG
jgi:membrane fusion protein (multidrug efflux system)